MRIRDGFMLRDVAGSWVVVPLGERVVEFNAIMTLSESGAFIWKKMNDNISEEALLEAILAEYDIDKETARSDLQEFLSMIRERNLVED